MRFLILPLLLTVPLLAAENSYQIVGSPTAPITLQLYSDFQCPHCKVLHFTTINSALSDCVAKGKVRIIYRDFPLPQHQYARLAARYANAAGRIGQYQKVCDQLFQLQDEWGTKGNVDAVVSRVLSPADMSKVRQAVTDAKLDQQVDQDMALGEKAGLTQTPTMVLTYKNKPYNVPGEVSYTILSKFIDSLLAK